MSEESNESSSQEVTPSSEKPITNEKTLPTGEAQPASSLLDRSREVAGRIEAANKKTEELLDRQERLASEQMLGGQADAGQAPVPKKEMTDEEYKEKILAGEKPELPK